MVLEFVSRRLSHTSSSGRDTRPLICLLSICLKQHDVLTLLASQLQDCQVTLGEEVLVGIYTDI